MFEGMVNLRVRIILYTVSLGLMLLSCNRNVDIGELPNSGKIPDELILGIELIEKGEFHEALALLEAIKDKQGTNHLRGMIANNLAVCHHNLKQYRQALPHYLDAIKYFDLSGYDKLTMQALTNTSMCLKSLGIYEKSVEYAKRTESFINKDTGVNPVNQALIYNLLGNIYQDMGRYPLAREYHQQSLEIRHTYSSILDTAVPLNNLGNLMFSLGKTDSAIFYFKLYESNARAKGDFTRLKRSFNNLAKVYLHVEQFAIARSMLDSSIGIGKRSEILYKDGYVEFLIADYYQATGKEELCTKHARKSLIISQKSGDQKDELEALARLEDVFSRRKQFDSAYHYAKLNTELKDSIEGKQVISRLFAHELFSRLEVKNTEIQKLNYERELAQIKSKENASQRNWLLALAIILIILGYISWLLFREKQRFVKEYFSSETTIILKSGTPLKFNAIIHIETDRNNVILVTLKSRIKENRITLKEFLRKSNLPKIRFVRIQHGIVINLDFVSKKLKTKLYLITSETPLPISPKYRFEVDRTWNKFDKARKGGRRQVADVLPQKFHFWKPIKN